MSDKTECTGAANDTECEGQWDGVQASALAARSINYIRDLVDHLPLTPNPEKRVIALSIGDPCTYGNLRCPAEAVEAVREAVDAGGRWDGYAPCAGHEHARDALATYLSHGGVTVKPRDVLLCSGCSHALDMAIGVLACPARRDNVLVPRPGFPLYRTLAEGNGCEVRQYRLLADKGWQVDLQDLDRLVDERTAAIVINNPSNPCGSVWPERHLRDICEVARRRRVPIIADEIYEQLVFAGKTWCSLLAVARDVPVLACGGLAKRYLVPGWRLGWLIIHDPPGAFTRSVRKGLQNLAARIIGSNTLVQAALAKVLLLTPQSFHDDLINTLSENARAAHTLLKAVPGLSPHMPQGTMYMMVHVHTPSFPAIDNTMQFVVKMMEEESVFCLPGECFGVSDYMRIVITPPIDVLLEACTRIAAFCQRHYVQT